MTQDNTTNWLFYRNGRIVPITEHEARHTFDSWIVLSDDRGAATLMTSQMWTEIDRLRGIVRINALRAGHSHAEVDAMLYAQRLTEFPDTTQPQVEAADIAKGASRG